MKTTLTALAAAALLSATAAHAGGVIEPVTPPAVIIEDTGANTSHLIVPAMFLIIMALGFDR